MAGTIQIAAALITNEAGALLLVRKRDTAIFMQPGGKIGAGEEPLAALAREVQEELTSDLLPGSVTFLGRFRAAAANEPGMEVEADLFRAQLASPPIAAAEIEELLWLDRDQAANYALAPLTYLCLSRLN